MYTINKDNITRAWQLLGKIKHELQLTEEENTFLNWFNINTKQYGFKAEYRKLRGLPTK